ncbi:HD-GYP domain-containing protein [Aromatoleum sp.]|uniref:HD-GYP domain-containing protein n=1 Tax=Aromatoleum sp. TaxID=2307007 RepID=UPI002FC8902D
MPDTLTEVIDIARLRVGHFVFVDLGGISHPFPLNGFRIQSTAQIEVLRALGIERIRYSPDRSDPEPCFPREPARAAIDDRDKPTAKAKQNRSARKETLDERHARLQACEREFVGVARSYRRIVELARASPPKAHESTQRLVAEIAGPLIRSSETCIHLLSERVGDHAPHEINVTVISLLLGKACGLDEAALHELGVAALLHDLGKLDLPDRLRYEYDPRSAAEQQLFQNHVGHGVAIGTRMGLSNDVLKMIAQHHERADGSGYPARLTNDRLPPGSRILTVANHYDNLCNPGNPALALTPHEALSQIFAHAKESFDATTVNVLVRMMGVYPAGSIVQLTDDRYALVLSVNATRLLKPRIIIHDPQIPRAAALVVDLAEHPALGIRRSLRPLQLPRAALDYLSPRTRICYFFEHARRDDDEDLAR